jgi:hypothetical protein
MPKEINDFFNAFGKPSIGITLPPTNSLEVNVKLLALHYDSTIRPGHGLFFDFSATPEYEKPVVDYLTSQLGWILEKPFFIRKQNHTDN